MFVLVLTATRLNPNPTATFPRRLFEEPSMIDVAFRLGMVTYTLFVFEFTVIADGLEDN